MNCSDVKTNLYALIKCDPEDLEAGAFDVQTACQIFEAQALKHPLQAALLYKDFKLTYAELNTLSNQLGRIIRRQYQQTAGRPLTSNDLIPISIERSADFVIGILAILKAGGAYVPINPEYPEHRIQHILSDINATIILTEPHLHDKYKSYDNKLNTLSIVKEELTVEEKDNLNVPTNPNDLAYVIYTSGSSGTPKGVMAKHTTLISQTVCASYFYADKKDTVAFFSDVSFDSTTTEIWGALLSGASLFIPDNFFELLSNPKLFKQTVLDNKISIVLLTRALFDLLYTLDETVFSDINFMMVGGEALTKNIMLKLATDLHKPKKLLNAYGPTENSTFCTTYTIEDDFSQYQSVPIGRPYSNRLGLVLDNHMQLMPIGITGELFVSGTSLSKGYLNHPDKTADKFIQNPFFELSGRNYPILYRTNDLVRWLPEGNLEYIGRNDFMVKLRGFRIELGEIETRLLEFPGIKHSVALMEKNDSLDYLVGYYVSEEPVDEGKLVEHLTITLPDYMIPSAFVHLSSLPVTTNGKLDRKALPRANFQEKKASSEATQEGDLSIEAVIKSIWCKILNCTTINEDQSFFNLGGNSLAAMIVRNELEAAFSIKINMVDLFQYTTVKLLSEHVKKQLGTSGKSFEKYTSKANSKSYHQEYNSHNEPIAIVGISCRLPGIESEQEFWSLLKESRSNLRDFTLEEIQSKNIDASKLDDKSYVKRGAVFDNPFEFDAQFFNYSAKDAELLDPQQRLFLECAWEALENSGNIPDKFNGEIGVFATEGRSTYYNDHVYASSVANTNLFQAILGNEKDFLSTRVSYKLNLTGPSITLQTACSSSLVAIQMACDSLRLNSCSMALAGGVSIFYNYGYPYQEDLIESPDGYCRAFDSKAKGTVITSGVAIVVLKKLTNAIADKDNIYALIKGGAINNDGASKMAFTAPSVSGQSAVIEKALKNADVNPNSISYIESHGTGTALGDPIEWTALHQVYQNYCDDKFICTIGAVKTNIGHTDSAAGAFGLIKSALMLKKQFIPATLNFINLNPEIAAFNKLFRVSNLSENWQSHAQVRRAAVSSFGLGGTNAHMILEEYAEQDITHSTKQWDPQCFLIPISAKNQASLLAATAKYKDFLKTSVANELENIAFTAQIGRSEFKERGFFIVFNQAENNANHIFCTHLQLKSDIDSNENSHVSIVSLNKLLVEISKIIQTLSSNSINITSLKLLSDLIVLALFGLLWCYEYPITLDKLQSFSANATKVPIPTYCFIRKHYEIPKQQPTIEQDSSESEIDDFETLLSPDEKLKSLWVSVLGIPANELSDSSCFLELGGDSLSYIDLFNGIKKSISSNFNLEEIIQHTKFSAMSEFIINRMKTNETATIN